MSLWEETKTRKNYLFFPFVHLLRLVLNPHDQLSFAGFLRSLWIRFKVDLKESELEEIIQSNRIFSFSDFPDKLIPVIGKLKKIYKASFSYSLEELFYLIFDFFPLVDLLQVDSLQINSLPITSSKDSKETILKFTTQLLLSARELEQETLSTNRDSILGNMIIKTEGLLGMSQKNRQLKVNTWEPSEANQKVSVMTIHKSKGLEFDVVFLADIQRKLDQSNKSYFFFGETQEGAYKEQPAFYLQSDMTSLSGAESPQKRHAKREMHESARILYVALTRAIQRIYITFVGSESKKNNSYHYWINRVIQEKGDSTGLFEIVQISPEEDHTSIGENHTLGHAIDKGQTQIQIQIQSKNKKKTNDLSHILSLQNPDAPIAGYQFVTASSLSPSLEEDDDKHEEFNYEEFIDGFNDGSNDRSNDGFHDYKSERSPSRQNFGEILGEISPKDIGTVIHKALEWVEFSSCEWPKTRHDALMSSFQIPIQHHSFLLDEIKNTLSIFQESCLFFLIRNSIILGREASFSAFYESPDEKSLPKETAYLNHTYDHQVGHQDNLLVNLSVGYIDLLIYLKKDMTIKDKVFPSGVYVIDYKTNKQPQSQTWESFQRNILEKYNNGMKLYQQAIRNYYQGYEVQIALYHTPSGELLIY